jgi:hypothetical protein
MSVSSVSFTVVNLYASQAPAKPVAAVDETSPLSRDRSCGSDAARPNRLLQAMMSALRELGVGGATPATTAGGGAAATSPADPAGASAVGIESAAHRFAHELATALRRTGGGDASHEDGDGDAVRRHGHRHHGHHAHPARRHESYAGLPQRLEALARTIGASPAAETTTAADAAGTATDDAGLLPAPAAPTATPPDALLDAFSRLFGALQPQPAPVPTASDLSATLRQFLLTLAQALRPEETTPSATAHVGAIVDVTA